MPIRYILIVVLTIGLSGCQWIRPLIQTNNPPAPVVFTEPVTQAQQVVDAMQSNAQRVKQLESAISVKVDGMPPLRGNLVVQTPKNLRLKAGLLGMTEMGIDVGSNDDVFWVWIKASAPGQQSALYYASHDQFQNSALKKSLPIEPQWILDAIGLLQFSATDHHESPFVRPDGNIQMNTTRQTPNGTVQKVYVLDQKRAWLKQQTIYVNGRRVAYADAVKFRYFPEYQVSLPKQIKIHVDQPNGQTMAIVVNFSDFRINQFYGDPSRAWAMPQLSDIPMIDITKLGPSGSQELVPISPRQPDIQNQLNTDGNYRPTYLPQAYQSPSQSTGNKWH